MADPPGSGIYVLAGVNGAGKSSILGETFLRHGQAFFNPDVATAEILAANPGMTRDEANAHGWERGRRMLESAIAERKTVAFETTLGGSSITALLHRASGQGQRVRVAYVGLDGVHLHIDRVRQRVAQGGHSIPEQRIRDRYDTSRLNLVRLLPDMTALNVFDNSRTADPAAGLAPVPTLVLSMRFGRVAHMMPMGSVPVWAKPIAAAALGQ